MCPNMVQSVIPCSLISQVSRLPEVVTFTQTSPCNLYSLQWENRVWHHQSIVIRLFQRKKYHVVLCTHIYEGLKQIALFVGVDCLWDLFPLQNRVRLLLLSFSFCDILSNASFYRPWSKGDNTFGSVCPSVRPCSHSWTVWALTLIFCMRV